MFTINIKIRESSKENTPGTIVFVIYENGEMRYVSFGIKSSEEELLTVNLKYVLSGMKFLCGIIEKFSNGRKSFTIDDVVDRFRKKFTGKMISDDILDGFYVPRRLVRINKPFDKYVLNSQGESIERLTTDNLVEFIGGLVDEMKGKSSIPTVRNYTSTLRAAEDYISTLPKGDRSIDGTFVTGFAEWLKGRDMTESTVSFYIRTLHAILSKAEKKGLIEVDSNWFKGLVVSYSPDKVERIIPVLSKNELNAIAHAVLKTELRMGFARDVFMFSFYCRGIELIDILSLTKENLVDNMLIYRKRQSGNKVSVPINEKILELTKKHTVEGSDKIFNFEKYYTGSNEFQSIKTVINRDLTSLFKQLDIEKKFAFSMARHTWEYMYKTINLSYLLLS